MYEICAYCGEQFWKTNSRQVYCSYECRVDSYKSIQLKKKQEANKSKPPKVTIDQIVAESNRLSEELGRYVSYGEVQQMLMAGKLKIGKEKKK